MLSDAANIILIGVVIVLSVIMEDFFSPARILRKLLWNTPVTSDPETILGKIVIGVLDILSWLLVLYPLAILLGKISE